MTIWYKKLNRTLNYARSKKRLLCSCTHGQKNGFSEARRCQKILWIQKPKRFVCATLFFVLLILFDSQLIISFHIYCQTQSVERFYSHDHSMQRLSRARLDRICCGRWRHRTTAEAVESESIQVFRRNEHAFVFKHPLRCAIDHKLNNYNLRGKNPLAFFKRKGQ